MKHGRRRLGSDGLLAASPFLLPSVLGLLLFSLLPLVISALISLTNWNGLDELSSAGFFAEHFVGLENFKSILTTREFWQVLWNTLRYIVMYIPLMLAAAIAVATLLSRPRRGVTAFRIIYYIPVLTSWVAASLIWKSVLSPQYGALNGILGFFGIEGPGWLLDEAWAMPAIVLVSVWKDMGFFGLILLSGMIGIDRTYYVLIVSLINAFQLFPQIMIMTDGGPNGSTQVMVERIYKYGFRYYRMGYAAAFSWLLFVIIMACTGLQMKLQKRWVNYDA